MAALIAEHHPSWGSGALGSAVMRTATFPACPADWQPLSPADSRLRCYGGGGRTSFFGTGIVNAEAAAQV